MPAIRRKDRCGPGITNCDEFESVPPAEEEVVANKSLLKQERTTKTDRHTGHFTAGFPLESARPHFT